MAVDDPSAQNLTQSIRRAGHHPVVERGARAGYVANAVLHGLLGWLALRLAWGDYSGEADQTQAFNTLSGHLGGLILLGLISVCFVLLGVWNAFEVFVVRELTDRVKHAAKAIVYAALAWGAFEVRDESEGSGVEKSQDATAAVMGHPVGAALVGIVGLGVIGVGGYMASKGVAKKYREDLVENPGQAVEMLAAVGYVAKGVALAIVGGLFVAAAVTRDPEKASGMDGALRALLELPLGSGLLTAIAVGFIAYGLYSVARAKYARV